MHLISVSRKTVAVVTVIAPLILNAQSRIPDTLEVGSLEKIIVTGKKGDVLENISGKRIQFLVT
ncbi:MAG: hypothetical protein JW915_25085 [Chitinispirillaceae bacterium]|nr:hypothetical protein [Chitinispirillaceae bacterium]